MPLEDGRLEVEILFKPHNISSAPTSNVLALLFLADLASKRISTFSGLSFPEPNDPLTEADLAKEGMETVLG